MKRWIGACFAGLCALLAAPEVRGDDLDHAVGTVVPASDEDLRSLIRYAEKLSGDGATCKKGKDESACVLADCGAGGDAARRLDETLALLQGMEPWVTMARKAALEHYKTLMTESIRKGDRQAELEKYYAYAKFLQDFGKLLLTAADLLDFAKNLQGNRDELAQLLADPGGAPSWKLLAKLDYYDSILGAVQNTADMADGVASQYRENGLGIPDSVQKLSTLKQGASDYKNAMRAGAEAYSLVRQAEVWRRYATTLTDAAEKTRLRGTVFDHVKNKLSLGFDFLGPQRLKNIDAEIPVYRANFQWDVAAPRSASEADAEFAAALAERGEKWHKLYVSAARTAAVGPPATARADPKPRRVHAPDVRTARRLCSIATGPRSSPSPRAPSSSHPRRTPS